MSLTGFKSHPKSTNRNPNTPQDVTVQNSLPTNVNSPAGESAAYTWVAGNLTRVDVTNPDGSITRTDFTYIGTEVATHTTTDITP